MQLGNNACFVLSAAGIIPPPPASTAKWGRTLIVDQTLGNNATAIRTDLGVYTFQTLAGARTFAQPGDNIIIVPGDYILAGSWGGINDLKVFCFPNVTISGSGIFSNLGTNFTFTGYGEIYEAANLFNNDYAGLGTIVIECNIIDCFSATIGGGTLRINTREYFSIIEMLFVAGSGTSVLDIIVTTPLFIAVDPGAPGPPVGAGIFCTNRTAEITRVVFNVDTYKITGKYAYGIYVASMQAADYRFEFNGKIVIDPLSTVTYVIRSLQSFPTDLTKGFFVNGNIYCDSYAPFRAIRLDGAKMRYSGTIFALANVDGEPTILLALYNAIDPSTLELYHAKVYGSDKTNGIIQMDSSNQHLVVMNDALILDTDPGLNAICIQSSVANTGIKVLPSAAGSNVPYGSNIIELTTTTAFAVDPQFE